MSPTSSTPVLGLHTPDIDVQAACVAACVRASTVCSVTADACLDDDEVSELRASIRMLGDCVDVLTATATVLSRHFGALPAPIGTLLIACADLADACAGELVLSAPLEHGQRCIAECRRAADACRTLLEATAASRTSSGRR